MDLLEHYQQFAMRTQHLSGDINGKVLLADGMNLYIRAFAATPTMDDDGTHVGGITGFLLSLASTIRMQKPTRVVIVFDGKGGSQRRRELFGDYKANRRTMQRLNRTYDFQTVEQEREAQKWQLLVLLQMLRCLPVTVLHPNNVEADDVLAYCAQTVAERGGESIIVSSDKDFLQLVNERVSVWSPVKKKMYRPDKVVEDYGFHPNNFLLYRMVTGDKSDNIPGVEGIQQKTLAKLFPELREAEKRTVDYLFETAERKIAELKRPPVVLRRLLDSREQLELNAKLMRLDDVAMSGTTRLQVLDEFDKLPPKLSKYELTKVAIDFKLIHAFGRWDEWVQQSFVPLGRFSTK